ncbi:uncharacterized protein LOC112086185 [Eutrema salsugineum]|uniref:uncharacterized protein LOC112086185 n=1 Tax=Eutrema salsugineum TaxID=72664 RepID=UPI000CED022F|nr:uncharacterized protein LOC112086185 [Eutrema salsugineum]
MRLGRLLLYIITRLAMTRNTTKKKMALTPPNVAALVLPLLIIFTFSSQVGVFESIGPKLD